jgi:hypothetical protein
MQQQSHILVSSWVGVCRDRGVEDVSGQVMGQTLSKFCTLMNSFFIKMVGYTLLVTTPGLDLVLCPIQLEEDMLQGAVSEASVV